MSTWTEEALSLWEFEWSTWSNIYASYGPYTFRVIKNPIVQRFQFSPSAKDKQADTILDFLRTDAIASGLYQIVTNPNPPVTRPIVTIRGARYTLNKLENDDDTQPSIRVNALLLQ